VSKSGISTSIGGRGAHITVGHGKVRETVGLPGTGLSYTHVEPTHKVAEPNNVVPVRTRSATRGLGWLLLLALLAYVVSRVR
jgi:hypothetical protein